jgi:hypothetical protein
MGDNYIYGKNIELVLNACSFYFCHFCLSKEASKIHGKSIEMHVFARTCSVN